MFVIGSLNLTFFFIIESFVGDISTENLLEVFVAFIASDLSLFLPFGEEFLLFDIAGSGID